MLKLDKIFYIYLLVFSVVSLLLLSLFFKVAPFTLNHVIYLCQQTLTNTSFVLPNSTPLVLSTVFLSVFVTGLMLFVVHLIKTKLFTRRILLKKVPASLRAKRIAQELNIAKKLDTIDSKKYFSFCYGIFKPRICISNSLIKSLNTEELKAVLAHEVSHLENKDPFKIMLSQTMMAMFFFIPTLKNLHHYLVLSKEIEADKYAVNILNNSNYLKSALVKTLTNPILQPAGLATFGRMDDLEDRILYLTEFKRLKLKFSYLRLAISFFVISFTFIFLNMPVYAIGDRDNDEELLVISSLNQNTCESQESNHSLFSSKVDFPSKKLDLQSSDSDMNYSPYTIIIDKANFNYYTK